MSSENIPLVAIRFHVGFTKPNIYKSYSLQRERDEEHSEEHDSHSHEAKSFLFFEEDATHDHSHEHAGALECDDERYGNYRDGIHLQ